LNKKVWRPPAIGNGQASDIDSILNFLGPERKNAPKNYG